jgi:alkaline phosphatase D
MVHPTRRTILKASTLAAPVLLTMSARATALVTGDYPFTLGVASGEPWPDGMVLWTRLAPRPLEPHGGLPPRPVAVRWDVAEDEHFTRIARTGTAFADPAAAHSVHVEVGGLRPGRSYFYRFIVGGEASPIGRTRTAPAQDATVDALRFCFGSCQKYEAGHYAAWTHVVAADPELIVFLGDYIYENAPTDEGVRRHLNPEPFDLAGYRIRYASYKLDPLLQAAHATAPWLSTWDDHEVANDYAGALDERNDDPATFLRRRAAAYQAYWEHMPLRASAHPSGPGAKLYRALGWGRLAEFQIIDDRQYRGSRACQPPELLAAHQQYLVNVLDCPQRHDPARTMLGSAQESWLLDRLGTTKAHWNLLTQQTLMAPFAQIDPAHADRGAILHGADRWEGYPAARERIFRRWAEAKTPNPVVLSGDIHAFAAIDIRHPDHLDGAPIAAEFVGGSITSLYHHAQFHDEARLNRGFRYVENEVRGFGHVELTQGRAAVQFRGLADARDPQSTVSTIASFEIEAGRAGIA